jgi:ubiquinol-cytochrome c reductase iron-sulfur subunit
VTTPRPLDHVPHPTVGAFVVALVAAGGAGVASIADAPDRLFGLAIAVALGAIGIGLVTWSKALPIDDEVVEEREDLTVTTAEDADLAEEGDLTRAKVGRRPVLVGLFATTLAALGAAILSPVLSLGPSISAARRRTSWAAGRRLVTSDGTPIAATDGRFDQLVTVFPEGHLGADDSQVVLLRVRPELIRPATVEAGAVDGWLAYSKICTHLGCSVGLLGIDTRGPEQIRQLVCPCHQSVFDPLDGARPLGGPAPRALPQLPLAVDDQGNLIATADFDRPVGPATWDEG